MPVEAGSIVADLENNSPTFELLPTLPGKTTGIVGLDPLRLQCGACGVVTERTERGVGYGVIASGFHFHTCEGRDGIRRCPACLEDAIAACPNGRCK